MHKAAILLALLTALPGLASAIEIEARVFRFTADAPPPAEILRLNENGLLPYTGSYIAELKPDGSFLRSATEAIPYTAYDEDGFPSGTDTCEVGVSFWGIAIRGEDGYNVQAALKTTQPPKIHMVRAENGIVFPKAVFQSRALKFNWLLEPGTWTVVPDYSRRDVAILIRVRE